MGADFIGVRAHDSSGPTRFLLGVARGMRRSWLRSSDPRGSEDMKVCLPWLVLEACGRSIAHVRLAERHGISNPECGGDAYGLVPLSLRPYFDPKAMKDPRADGS
jgi:hypothetical protein